MKDRVVREGEAPLGEALGGGGGFRVEWVRLVVGGGGGGGESGSIGGGGVDD